MEYKLFWGCTIPARIPFVETSARKVFEKMKLPVSDLENTSCCPDPTGIPAVDQKTWLTLGARNLSLIENDENEIISLCSGCVETLKTVNHILNEYQEKKDEINGYLEKLNKKFDRNVSIKHAAQLLYENIDKIKENVVKPLKGFKVAVHYGCHFLRPSDIIKWDNPDDPTTIDEIVKALGAECIDYELKLECCGCPVGKSDLDLSNRITYQKLDSVSKSGANCIAVVCPACFTHFDFNQRMINKKFDSNFEFPIFYLTELIAMAMGADVNEIGLKFHGVKVKKLLEETAFTSP